MKIRVLGVLAVFLGALVFCNSAIADMCTEPVATGSGFVQGMNSAERETCEWRGIPYAAPPVGELRWQAPQPAPQWSGVKETVTFGDRCMQEGTMTLVDSGSDVEMSEDCLYLNVWRPKKAGKFPVMLWIHGGGYTGGSSSTEMYWGDRLAESGEVVVVTINYRLSVFGFLAHPELTKEDPDDSSGSYGSLDQVAAIQWVHDNIENFGGDPDNVTIFGESAGGWSVCTMLATPLNKGKIHKAIMESGGCETSASMEKGYEQARNTARALGCSPGDIECLRNVPAEEILDKGTSGQAEGFVWVPHHDGHLLTDMPLAMIRQGNYNKIPFMAGSNTNEVDAVLLLIPQVKYALPSRYDDLLKKYLGLSQAETEIVTELYPLCEYNNKPKRAMTSLATDAGLACPTYTGLVAAAEQQESTYYYRFDYTGMAMGRWIKAAHAMEIPFIFNSMDRKPMNLLYNFANIKEARKLSRIIQGYWINFAYYGDPNGPEVPDWPAFQPDSTNMQELDLPVTTREAQMADKCEFWEEYNRKHGAIFETMGELGD